MRAEMKIRHLKVPSEEAQSLLSNYLINFYKENSVSADEINERFDFFYQFKLNFLIKYPGMRH